MRSVAIKRPNDKLVNNQSGPAAASATAVQSPSIAVLRDVHFDVDSGKTVFSALDIEIRPDSPMRAGHE